MSDGYPEVPPAIINAGPVEEDLLRRLAFELYELHQRTGISLDNWNSAREFVEHFHGPLVENGV